MLWAKKKTFDVKKSSRFKKPKSRVNGLNDNLNNIKKNKKKIDKKIKD
jgi:hypothetical protein